MFQLKKISRESIPEALEKAERYRLLNEPRLAESICLDILEADPQNAKAIVTLLLSITDQFGDSSTGEYEKKYYAGLISERQGKTILGKNIPDRGFIAYEWLKEAMEFYEKAESIRPPGNDDAMLRWNTCARLIMRYHLKPRDEKYVEYPLE
jgi:hypothetical protein